MPMQYVENLLRRYRGQQVTVKTSSGGIYEGEVAEITNDYVSLKVSNGDDGQDTVFVVIQAIESILPRAAAG